jgi:hypothetical protein
MIMCQQCNNLRTTAYTLDDGHCDTEICRVVFEAGYEIGMVEPGTVQEAALTARFVYIYYVSTGTSCCIRSPTEVSAFILRYFMLVIISLL